MRRCLLPVLLLSCPAVAQDSHRGPGGPDLPFDGEPIDVPGGGSNEGRFPPALLTADTEPATSACDTDRYVVNVPQWVPTPAGMGFGFQDRLQGALTAMARTRGIEGGWFCRTIDECAAEGERLRGGLVARVEPALPRRADIDQRRSGHLRFWRIAFYWAPEPEAAGPFSPRPARRAAGLDSVRLGIRDGATCEVVATLREVASQLAGSDALHVSRECAATVLGQPAGTDADWHLRHIGARPAASGGRVVLVDSGLEAAALSDEISEWVAPEPLFDFAFNGSELLGTTGLYHRHGTAMALLIRQLASGAELVSHSALDGNGHGALGRIAAAIDHAVFTRLEAPTIINLSIGWGPELERRRALEGDGCDTWEDPVGAPVAYALYMAALRDRRRLTRRGDRVGSTTLVVAAAGNRADIHADTSAWFRHEAEVIDAPIGDPCGEPAGRDLFYPAQWSRRGVCAPGTARGSLTPVLAVGATDRRDRAATLAPPVPEPALVAPGEHIHVTVETGLGDARHLVCGAGGPQPTPQLGLPATVSGSSASAALTTGAAAQALAFLGGARLPMDATSVEGILHSTGRPTARKGVRRLDVGRLSRALRCRHRARLVTACARALDRRCAVYLLACGLRERPIGRPDDDGGDDDDRATCRAAPPAEAQWHELSCPGPDCPEFTQRPDAFSAGVAGPQPVVIGCEECRAELQGGVDERAGAVDLKIDIDPALPTGTRIDQPFLMVKWFNGRKSYVSLGGHTQPSQWRPGAVLRIDGLSVRGVTNDLRSDWKRSQAFLVTRIRTPNQSRAASDVAPFKMVW